MPARSKNLAGSPTDSGPHVSIMIREICGMRSVIVSRFSFVTLPTLCICVNWRTTSPKSSRPPPTTARALPSSPMMRRDSVAELPSVWRRIEPLTASSSPRPGNLASSFSADISRPAASADFIVVERPLESVSMSAAAFSAKPPAAITGSENPTDRASPAAAMSAPKRLTLPSAALTFLSKSSVLAPMRTMRFASVAMRYRRDLSRAFASASLCAFSCSACFNFR